MFLPYNEMVERKNQLKNRYPVGTRIKIVSLCNYEPTLPCGSIGTVKGYDDALSLLMSWDNGSSLNILPYDGDVIVKV